MHVGKGFMFGAALVVGVTIAGASAASASSTVWYDTTGDGIGDEVHLDLDGDGYTDVVGADADQNGWWEGFIADFDANGSFETTAIDSNGDGIIDLVAVDTDHDLVWDRYFTDRDANGLLDQLETSAVPAAPSNDQTINDIMVQHIVTMQQIDIYWDNM
jgi:hypothetical protein